MRRVFIGTVGYQNLRNHSIGPILLPRLQTMTWPAGVEIDELNWGPIAVVQQFQALDVPYDRIIILTALERGRPIGALTLRRWMGGLPHKAQIQACIGDAVTGVISVENLLIIGEYFKIWPAEVFVIDVEPGPEQAGEHLTPAVAQHIPEVLEAVQSLVLTPIDALPVMQMMVGYPLVMN